MNEELLNILSAGEVRVIFRKRTNRLIRSLLCTLNPKMIPPEHLDVFSSIMTNLSENRFIVWDIESNDWRSFYLDSIIDFKPELENSAEMGQTPK
jgi:hypothetical protein|tara:strand:- start:78 stop:362 length:285 start_codon:yes stop_codon:yes gene_type:complete